MKTTCAIVPAAGRGLRMGRDKPKQFLELSGRSILAHTLTTLVSARFLSSIFVVVPEDYISETEQLVSSLCDEPALEVNVGVDIHVVAGGAERQDSVLNGLRRLPEECEWVLIHDGVRPFVSVELLERTWSAALESGASITALPATDTIKRVLDGRVVETIPREEIWLVQTPQVFRKDLLAAAYAEAVRHGWMGTDDASFIERLNIPVSVVKGERLNIKVTTPEDLEWVSWCLARGGDAEGRKD